MKVHLVDGTYELFRFHYGPSNKDPRRGAQRGVLNTVLDLVAGGATHIGIATDQVIESFRNDLYDGYKDGSGVEPDLLAQFPEIEDLLELAGFTVWPQVTHEADDGMAAGAAMAVADEFRATDAMSLAGKLDQAQGLLDEGRASVAVELARLEDGRDARLDELKALYEQAAVAIDARAIAVEEQVAGALEILGREMMSGVEQRLDSGEQDRRAVWSASLELLREEEAGRSATVHEQLTVTA